MSTAKITVKAATQGDGHPADDVRVSGASVWVRLTPFMLEEPRPAPPVSPPPRRPA